MKPQHTVKRPRHPNSPSSSDQYLVPCSKPVYRPFVPPTYKQAEHLLPSKKIAKLRNLLSELFFNKLRNKLAYSEPEDLPQYHPKFSRLARDLATKDPQLHKAKVNAFAEKSQKHVPALKPNASLSSSNLPRQFKEKERIGQRRGATLPNFIEVRVSPNLLKTQLANSKLQLTPSTEELEAIHPRRKPVRHENSGTFTSSELHGSKLPCCLRSRESDYSFDNYWEICPNCQAEATAGYLYHIDQVSRKPTSNSLTLSLEQQSNISALHRRNPPLSNYKAMLLKQPSGFGYVIGLRKNIIGKSRRRIQVNIPKIPTQEFAVSAELKKNSSNYSLHDAIKYKTYDLPSQLSSYNPSRTSFKCTQVAETRGNKLHPRGISENSLIKGWEESSSLNCSFY